MQPNPFDLDPWDDEMTSPAPRPENELEAVIGATCGPLVLLLLALFPVSLLVLIGHDRHARRRPRCW